MTAGASVFSPVTLDAAQAAVVAHIAARSECLLVTGGPGTGKTTCLVAAAARLVSLGVPLGQVVILTYARPAALRLRRAVIDAVGVTQAGPRIVTVHGWCKSLIDQFGRPGDQTPVRLLSAPEQEFLVRELLDAVSWPAALGDAPATPEFAGQVRALITRARQLGLDPDGLCQAGRAAGRPDWEAAGRFFETYLTVIDDQAVLDYAELVHRSRLLMAQPDVAFAVRAHTAAVLVDEFAECDESVVALLRDVWRAGVPVTAFADPSTRLFEFRGAWAGAPKRFPEEFAQAYTPAPVIELVGTYRTPEDVQACLAEPGNDVAVVAGQLWQERAAGVAWQDMAVIGRASGDDLGRMARGLAAAGVPVRLEGETLALAQTGAVAVLLDGLSFLVALAAGVASVSQWQAVLGSPLVGIDSLDLKWLARLIVGNLPGPAVGHDTDQLNDTDQLGDADPGGVLVQLLVAAAAGAAVPDLPTDVAALWQRLVVAVRQLQQLAESALTAPVGQLAWDLWQIGDWPEKLRQTALRRSSRSLAADRDLDAVIALFDLAAAHLQWRGASGVAALAALTKQQIVPRDRSREVGQTIAEVSVLSAYQAKGRQWPVVAVVGAVEGVWPSPFSVPSLLQADRLQADGQLPALTGREIVDEQRRLFVLATSRALRHLVVVGAPADNGDPVVASRFLAERGLVARRCGAASVGFTQAGLVGQLRAAASDVSASPGLAGAARAMLTELAAMRHDDGRPVAPAADPRSWWWLSAETPPASQRPDQPTTVSASEITAVLDCPRRWFLQRRAGANPGRLEGAAFGTVAHWLFQRYGEPGAAPQFDAHRVREWLGQATTSSWRQDWQVGELEVCLARFVAWRDGRASRRLVGMEVGFSQLWQTPGGEVEVAGRVDRVELDAAGRLVVIDYKTSNSADVASAQDQLGVYALAAKGGAFGTSTSPAVAPPELVWPRIAPRRGDVGCRVDVAPPGCLDETWVLERVGAAAAIIASGRYPATACSLCRTCAFTPGCPEIEQGSNG